MVDDPYLATDAHSANPTTPSAGRTFVVSFRALSLAVLVTVVICVSVAVAEKYYQWWTYTRRAELSRSLARFPRNGGILNRSDELRISIVTATFTVLPYVLLSLLIFVPLFLWLNRPRSTRP